jgi:hypothetical protein
MHVVTDDGQWVNEHFHRLAEIIKDYDPALELQWIPPGQRSEEADKKYPFRIFDSRSRSVVMFCSERDSAEHILARLWGADNQHGSVLDRMDAANAAREAMRLKENMDAAEMRKDLAAFLIATPLNTIRIRDPLTNEKIAFDDQLRRKK